MATVTLAEASKLTQDELLVGIIEDIITINPMFKMMPFRGIDGSAYSYNRENELGDVISAGVGTSFTGAGAGNNPASFTKVTTALTTIMGNAEVNGLIQSTHSGGTDQTAAQIQSKAKATGREYQRQMIEGTGSANEFVGLISLCSVDQTVQTGANGDELTLDLLDELLDTVTDKDGQADYIMMHVRTRRAYHKLLRALGGANINEVVTMANGDTVEAYNGVPLFRNDFIPTDLTKGTSVNASPVFAGTWDDGSGSHGIVGLTSENDFGIVVEEVGPAEDKDEHIWRVKWYCSLALHCDKGLAKIDAIVPPA